MRITVWFETAQRSGLRFSLNDGLRSEYSIKTIMPSWNTGEKSKKRSFEVNYGSNLRHLDVQKRNVD
ncbi:hypothetical protein RCL_jg26033.t1 [Rhizophagus clarus]|uniref:Uncharacterized protein n=1 Tax=Rhizophagus clarus TaxID=94130 RepID=A0A8H3QFJ1_9GLOM|nr:hypothetical protein RCL_jg26033.t1 [Rhizophagus clarus]